jgi:hypothetical protein
MRKKSISRGARNTFIVEHPYRKTLEAHCLLDDQRRRVSIKKLISLIPLHVFLLSTIERYFAT